MLEIPLNSSPEQILSTTIDGEVYTIRVIYNSRTGVWTADFSNKGIELLVGVTLVGGTNIFNQYNIPIKTAYVVNLENNKLDATAENLGSVVKLFILTEGEVDSVSSV